jgi:cell division septal protein FtsQ
MDHLDPLKRQLVVAALKEQEQSIRLAKTGLAWWKMAVFLAILLGLAWLLHRELIGSVERTDPVPNGGLILRMGFLLLLVAVMFLLAQVHALHRRIDALISLLGEQQLSQRTVGEIRAISQMEAASGDDGQPVS